MHPVLKHNQTHFFFNVRDLTANGQVPSQVHTGFVVNEVVLGYFFLRLFRFYPVTVIRRARLIHPSPIAYNLSNLQLRKIKVSLSVAQFT